MKTLLASGLAILGIASSAVAQQVGPGYVPAYFFFICTNDRGSSVNVRSMPTTASRSLGQLRDGTPVRINRRFVSTADAMWWTHVSSPYGQGFVRDDYVCVGQ